MLISGLSSKTGAPVNRSVCVLGGQVRWIGSVSYFAYSSLTFSGGNGEPWIFSISVPSVNSFSLPEGARNTSSFAVDPIGLADV